MLSKSRQYGGGEISMFALFRYFPLNGQGTGYGMSASLLRVLVLLSRASCFLCVGVQRIHGARSAHEVLLFSRHQQAFKSLLFQCRLEYQLALSMV